MTTAPAVDLVGRRPPAKRVPALRHVVPDVDAITPHEILGKQRRVAAAASDALLDLLRGGVKLALAPDRVLKHVGALVMHEHESSIAQRGRTEFALLLRHRIKLVVGLPA